MSDADDRHRARMQRKQAVVADKISAAQIERGVFLLHTGIGKGKSSAAFGMLARALGHGLRTVVIQFVKSRADTGEVAFFRQHPRVQWRIMGEGCTWKTQDAERDAIAARAAWEIARQTLTDPAVDLLILDEFTYAFKYRWLELEPVLAAIHARPPLQHLIVTGRAAPPEFIAAADTVTEMSRVKHALQVEIHAMPGIEF